MSLSTQTRIRLPKIQEGLRQGLTHDQIAENCKVTSRTIERDLYSWYESGEFETWLKAEFVELYEYVRTANPTVAFKELARLMGKMVTRKAEIKTEDTITEKMEVDVTVNLRDYEKTIRAAVERDFQLHNTKQPLHTTQTNTETS